MNKLLLAIAVGTLTISSVASANLYVQADVGLSKTRFTSYSDMNETKVEPRISIGKRFGVWRFAIDYSYHGKFSGNNISAKTYGLGFSGFYDINTYHSLKPYVGVRLSTNVFDVDGRNPSYLYLHKETKFGYGFLAGVSYNLAPQIDLNGGLEYHRLGTYEDTKVNNYGAKVGIRFQF